MTNDEFLDIVDEDGNNTGVTKLKSEVQKNGDWYRSAHVWIVNNGQIMLQKRVSSKNFFPDKFDVACAGHVRSGENYTEAALREIREELRIDVAPKDLIFIGLRKQVSVIKEKNLISKAIMGIFCVKLTCKIEDIKFNKSEISEIKMFNPEDLKTLLRKNPDIFVEDKDYFYETIEKILALM